MIRSLVFSLPNIIKLVLLMRDPEEDERKLDDDKYIQEEFVIAKFKQERGERQKRRKRNHAEEGDGWKLL